MYKAIATVWYLIQAASLIVCAVCAWNLPYAPAEKVHGYTVGFWISWILMFIQLIVFEIKDEMEEGGKRHGARHKTDARERNGKRSA